jgi:hypothetical protein
MLKTISSITNAIGALNYKGTWNASTNTPTLASGVGTKGDYYVVSVAGSTTLDGISNWGVGDLVTYNGSIWQRVEGGADLNGVNLSVSGTTTLSGLTASTALALDASKNVVSVTNTGTGNNVLATAPTLVGDVALSTGNLVIGTSGKGIDFSATPGTGTSELLDDYEEGTWSPIYSADTPPTTPFTMSNISATYTKIGRLVTARAFIRTDNVNTAGASGGVRIGNLPFSSATDEWSVAAIGFSAEFAVNNALYGLVRSGSTEISLFYRALAPGGQTPLALTDLTSGAAASKNQLVFLAQYYSVT